MTDQAVKLSATDVGKRFGEDWVVEGVDLHAEDQRVIGLIGPSGCGKTTLVRLLNGALAPDSGSVELLGKDPRRFAASDRQRIGYLPQQPVLFPELSLWGNLNFHASLAGVRFRRRARLREMLDFVDLGPDRRKKVSEASGGMQRRLALAASLVHGPEILFLDEPTAGIDPILRRRIWERLHDLRDRGTLLVVTTQYVNEAAYCDDVGVLSDGRLVAFGPPLELSRSAYGGDIVEFTTLEGLSDELLDESGRLDGVVAAERLGPHQARLVVTEVEPALDLLRGFLEDQGVESSTVEEPATDFDEVFIRIVERARSGDDGLTLPDGDSTAPAETSAPMEAF